MASSAAKAFGGGDAYEEPDGDEAMPDESEGGDLPPDYEAAYEEYATSPSAQTFWAAVKACTEAYEGGGMALLIGKGKPKKS